jgi:hypothetical protein
MPDYGLGKASEVVTVAEGRSACDRLRAAAPPDRAGSPVVARQTRWDGQRRCDDCRRGGSEHRAPTRIPPLSTPPEEPTWHDRPRHRRAAYYLGRSATRWLDAIERGRTRSASPAGSTPEGIARAA